MACYNINLLYNNLNHLIYLTNALISELSSKFSNILLIRKKSIENHFFYPEKN